VNITSNIEGITVLYLVFFPDVHPGHFLSFQSPLTSSEGRSIPPFEDYRCKDPDYHIEDYASSLLKTTMGFNEGIYPDLAKRDATPNKFHLCKDTLPCP